MTETYSIYASLNFQHQYFSNGILKGVELRPSASAQVMMQMYGLLFRPEPGGFLLARRQEAPAVPQEAEFWFWLRFTDPYFFNYTSGPSGIAADGVYLFDVKAADAGQVPVSWTAVPVRPVTFSYPVTPEMTEVNIVNQATGATWYATSFAAGSRTSVSVFLGGAPEGLYTVNGGAEPWNFFLLPTGNPDGAQALVRVTPPATAGATFSVSFIARQTFWKYILVPGPNRNGNKQYTITGQGMNFSTCSPSSGNTDMISEAPVLFSEVPGVKLQLVEVNGNGQKVVLPDLPFPSPRMMRKGTGDNSNTYYAETYVYL